MSSKTSVDRAALVVLYNPPPEFVQNLLSYSDYVSKIYIFDNSEAPNQGMNETLKQKLQDKISIHSNFNNVGLGVALNRGAEWALRDGYDWLLTMDQDSSFTGGAFFEEFEKFNDRADVAIFSPNQVLSDQSHLPMKHSVIEEMIVMTSGNLLNLKARNHIGPFNEKLFIDELDHEYCLRARKMNFRILKFIDIALNHNLGSPLIVQRKRKNQKIVSQHSPVRVYYITRNNLFIFKSYFFVFPRFVLLRMKNLIIFYRNIIFFQVDKWNKIRYGLKGMIHFVIGRYGRL